jgi:tetratricopeptide (TPR) repeat protein
MKRLQYVVAITGVLCVLVGCGNTAMEKNQDTEAIYNAYSMLAQGNYEAAADEFAKLQQSNKDNLPVLVGLIKANIGNNAYEQALNILEPAVKQWPKNRELWLYKAWVCEAIDDFTGATGAYYQAIELAPAEQDTWNRLEALCVSVHDIQAMTEMYRKAILQFPETLRYVAALVSAYLEDGNTGAVDEYISTLEEAEYLSILEYGMQAYKSILAGNITAAEELLFDCRLAEELQDLTGGAEWYFGEYDEDARRSGIGVCFYGSGKSNTQIYIGEWREGSRNGNGTAFSGYYSSNSRHTRTLANDEKLVYFVESFSTETLSCPWKDDLPEGAFIVKEWYKNVSIEAEYSIYDYESSDSTIGNMIAGLAQGEMIQTYGNNNNNDSKTIHQMQDGKPVPFEHTDQWSGETKMIYELYVWNNEYSHGSWQEEPCQYCDFSWDTN